MSLNLVNLLVLAESQRAADAFMTLVGEGRHKIAVADVGGGWTQLIESHYDTPPSLASELSAVLNSKVAFAGIYEGSGDAIFHLFDAGSHTLGWEDDAAEDLAHKVQHAVEELGLNAPLLMFQETVRRDGWRMVEKR